MNLLQRLPAWAYLLATAVLLIALVAWCTTHGTRDPGQLTRRQQRTLGDSLRADTARARQHAAAGNTHLDTATARLAAGRRWAQAAHSYEKHAHATGDTSLSTLRQYRATHP